MKLLIWVCALCFAGNKVSGMFFELPDRTATTADGSTNDGFIGEAISGLNEYFDGRKDTSQQKGSSSSPDATTATTSASSGFLDEMEMSLEHATDKLDGLWQQFRKGLLNLMGSDDVDGLDATATGNLQQLKPVAANVMLAKTTSTTVMPTTTATTLVTATTTMRPATELETPTSTPLP